MASKAIRELIEHEFSLVSELNYENFFITVEDIVSLLSREEFYVRVGVCR